MSIGKRRLVSRTARWIALLILAIAGLLTWWSWFRGTTRGPELRITELSSAGSRKWPGEAGFPITSDPTGRYVWLQQAEFGRRWVVYVFDTQTGRAWRIAAAQDSAGDPRRVVQIPVAWKDDQLQLVAWHWVEPAGVGHTVLRRLLGSSPYRSFVHCEHWSLDLSTRELRRIGVPTQGRNVFWPSPDGRWRLAIDHGRVKVLGSDGVEQVGKPVRANTSLLVPTISTVWLSDSNCYVVLDQMGLRQIDHRTGAELWKQTIGELEVDVFGPFGSSNYQPGMTKLPTGLYGPWKQFRHGSETFLHFSLRRLMQPDQATVVEEVWQMELPARRWTRLGPGAQPGVVYDPMGRFRVELSEAEGEWTVRENLLPGDTRQELFRGSLARPHDMYSSLTILTNPDRLIWLDDDGRLWSLPLEGTVSPQQLWPRERAQTP